MLEDLIGGGEQLGGVRSVAEEWKELVRAREGKGGRVDWGEFGGEEPEEEVGVFLVEAEGDFAGGAHGIRQAARSRYQRRVSQLRRILRWFGSRQKNQAMRK